jgi:hypothetical protein
MVQHKSKDYSGGNRFLLRSPRSWTRIAAEKWNSTKSRVGSFRTRKKNSADAIPSVLFAGKVDIYYTLARQDYSKRERKASWFDERDHQRTVETCQKILKRDGEFGSHCIRGLERWNTLDMALTAMNRGDARRAVLDEQAVQRKVGKYCDDTIAGRYRNVSQRCQTKALKLARQDAIDASEYLAKGCSRFDTSRHVGIFPALGQSPPTRSDELWQQLITAVAIS